MDSKKKIRVGYVNWIPSIGKAMSVNLSGSIWRTTKVIKIEELPSDGKPRVFRAETANTVYIVAYNEGNI